MPTNYLFGGGGRVSLWFAELTQTIKLSLMLLPPPLTSNTDASCPSSSLRAHLIGQIMSLGMQKQSKENCCASNGEASPKRIDLFGFYFWEFIFFNGKIIFFLNKKIV